MPPKDDKHIRMTSIKISEIKVIFDKIIDKLESLYGEDAEMDLNALIYRFIPTENRSKFEKPEDWYSASEIVQGDLQDDIKELKKLVENKDQLCMFIDFDRLANVLLQISHEVNPIEEDYEK